MVSLSNISVHLLLRMSGTSRNIGWSKTLSEGCASLASLPAGCTEFADDRWPLNKHFLRWVYSITTVAALDLLISVALLYCTDISTYRLEISYSSSSRRNLLTRPVLSGSWTIGVTASVCPDIESSAGASQHATEPYPLPNLHAFLFPLAATIDLLISITMSQPPSTSIFTPSSNFQSIFNAALKAYEKKTKKDLLAHPLAAPLQACKSPGDIIAVLQDEVNEFDQARSADERLSQWLNPTINVLYSFSATLGAGVGLVSVVKSTCPLTHSSPISQVFSPASVIFSGIGVLLSVSIVFGPCVEAILTMKYISGG